MHLIPVQPVDHLTAGIFQPPGPGNVVFLVKPGPKLHQNYNLFSIFSSFDQRLHNLALFCHPVKAHFYRNHTLILRCLRKQLQEGADGFKGIGKKLVSFLNLRQNTLPVSELRRFLGRSLFIKQLRLFPQQILDAKQKRHLQGDLL